MGFSLGLRVVGAVVESCGHHLVDPSMQILALIYAWTRREYRYRPNACTCIDICMDESRILASIYAWTGRLASIYARTGRECIYCRHRIASIYRMASSNCINILHQYMHGRVENSMAAIASRVMPAT